MTTKSVLREVREIQLATTLIQLGARLQFLESEVQLSRERLVRLYKEIKGVSPPKGLLPFSADWYMTWLANIHSSLFFNIYQHMAQDASAQPLEPLIKAYEMYLQQVQLQGETAILDFTRAYTLVRFHASKIVQLTSCSRCTGKFITHGYEGRNRGYVCVLCRPPSRAGKPSRSRQFTELVQSEGAGNASATNRAAADADAAPSPAPARRVNAR